MKSFWMRLDVDFDLDPYVSKLTMIEQHVLVALYRRAARVGRPTFDDNGEPRDMEVDLQHLEPGSFASRAKDGDPAVVLAALERLTLPVAATMFSPELPAPLVVHTNGGFATVRNAAHYQREAILAQIRMRSRRAPNSREQNGTHQNGSDAFANVREQHGTRRSRNRSRNRSSGSNGSPKQRFEKKRNGGTR